MRFFFAPFCAFRFPVFFFSLCAWCAVFLLCACGKEQERERPAPPPVPVVTAKAVTDDAPHMLHAVGEVKASETVIVHSRVDGMIVKTHFLDGAAVQAGDVLYTIDPEILELTRVGDEARVSELRVQAENAQTDYIRYKKLFSQGVVSREELDGKETAAKSAVEAMRQNYAKAQMAQRQVDYATISAPISGRAGATDVREGSVISAYTEDLVTIRTITPAEVAFALPQRHLPTVRRYMDKEALHVEATPAGQETPEQGILFFVDNWVDPNTGMITLKARFPNTGENLWPGQFTTVSLILYVQHDAVMVPLTALQHGPDEIFVYVVREGKAVVRPVTIGVPVEGDMIVIEKGLAAGETVVVDGQLRLSPGAAVREAEPGKDAAPQSGSAS